jgi:UDP-N-acetylmuramate dehydrogenase
MKLERDVELARYTTLGSGGRARAFARPTSIPEVEELVRWSRDEGLPVAVVGLGSNLLAADDGVDALVLHLEGDLARVDEDSELLIRAGGGATNAVCLHRARDLGLTGFEFAAAIPGTIGGGVRMNAGAYGGEFSEVLDGVLVATADGTGWMTPSELGLSYRHSDLQHGQVVVEVLLKLWPGEPDEIKSKIRELNAQRKAAQPTNRRTFGSVFKNPEHELSAGRMLEACGLKGHRIGGAQISPKHANFIENADGARSADAIALMAEARRRAFEQFGVELQHEVVFLGGLELPSLR